MKINETELEVDKKCSYEELFESNGYLIVGEFKEIIDTIYFNKNYVYEKNKPFFIEAECKAIAIKYADRYVTALYSNGYIDKKEYKLLEIRNDLGKNGYSRYCV